MIGFNGNNNYERGNGNNGDYERTRDRDGRFTENNYGTYYPMGMVQMREISNHMQTMDEKLKSAEQNARSAYSLKQSNPQQGRSYYEMATDDMKHAGYMHDMLNKETESGRTSDEYAKLMWDKINEDYTNMMTKIKMLLHMYEGR